MCSSLKVSHLYIYLSRMDDKWFVILFQKHKLKWNWESVVLTLIFFKLLRWHIWWNCWTEYTCDLSPPNFSNLNTLVLMSAAYRRCWYGNINCCCYLAARRRSSPQRSWERVLQDSATVQSRPDDWRMTRTKASCPWVGCNIITRIMTVRMTQAHYSMSFEHDRSFGYCPRMFP